jgi:predicted RNA-binding Zn ribbon-like protein
VSETGIPEQVALVRDFVNTFHVEEGEDDIRDPATLRDWLAARGLEAGSPGPANVRRARELREALRDLLLANNQVDADTDAARVVVEEAGSRARIELRFGPGGTLVPVPTAGGADGALGAIVAAVSLATHDETWTRLKACRAETCHWAYYDQARNQSRAWCSMEVCGNREKVRSFRRRQAGA